MIFLLNFVPFLQFFWKKHLQKKGKFSNIGIYSIITIDRSIGDDFQDGFQSSEKIIVDNLGSNISDLFKTLHQAKEDNKLIKY